MQDRTGLTGFTHVLYSPAPRRKKRVSYLDNEQDNWIFGIVGSWIETLNDSSLRGNAIARG